MISYNFLRILCDEGKLAKISASSEFSSAYVNKSKRYFEASELLIKHSFFEESISITYYSMYYALLALLFRIGIKSENHSASIFLLKKVFDIDNFEMKTAKTERIDKQYYLDFEVSNFQSLNFLKIAREFNKKLYDFIVNLSLEDVKLYSLKFENLIS